MYVYISHITIVIQSRIYRHTYNISSLILNYILSITEDINIIINLNLLNNLFCSGCKFSTTILVYYLVIRQEPFSIHKIHG